MARSKRNFTVESIINLGRQEMDINNIVITGTGELAERIEKLFSKAGLNVSRSNYNFSNADMVIEVFPEDIETKKRAFHRGEKQAQEKAIFATTASFGVTEIAAATRRAQRLVGLNFTFNPFQEKCLIQIVRGLETSEETIQSCRSLVEGIGATAVEVEDSPGLILDRVMASIVNEAATIYASRMATIEDIDRITKLCLNWPMGPFEFADTIGIDNVLTTLEVLSQRKGPQFLPCRLLEQMVAMGQLGKKTGKGFYSYS